MPAFTISAATPANTPALVALFTQAVHKLAAGDYSVSQLTSWAPPVAELSVQIAHWHRRLQHLTTYIACDITRDKHPLAGFIAVAPAAHIELLFTHPDFARQGVASALYQHAVALMPTPRPAITTHASVTARAFFERQGLAVVGEEWVTRNGESLRRFRMRSIN